MGGLIVGIILILIGISALTGIPFFGFLFALVLIAIGVRMIARRSVADGWHWDDHHHDHGHDHGTAAPASGERTIDEVAIFSALNRSYATEHFKGGKIVMVFSGGEIDLTQVKVDGSEIHLEVSSIFSGIQITIPKDWKVVSTANVFLGGVDTSNAQGGDGAVTLVIHGDAVFGGIEVRK
jgi:predicted membrane protein